MIAMFCPHDLRIEGGSPPIAFRGSANHPRTLALRAGQFFVMGDDRTIRYVFDVGFRNFSMKVTRSERQSAYDLPLGAMRGKVSLLTDASYISDFYDNIRNFSGQRHNGYALVNAGVAWASADETWMLKAYVRNLFKENYVETAFDIATLCGCSEIQYSKPRWWTVSLRKEF